MSKGAKVAGGLEIVFGLKKFKFLSHWQDWFYGNEPGNGRIFLKLTLSLKSTLNSLE